MSTSDDDWLAAGISASPASTLHACDYHQCILVDFVVVLCRIFMYSLIIMEMIWIAAVRRRRRRRHLRQRKINVNARFIFRFSTPKQHILNEFGFILIHNGVPTFARQTGATRRLGTTVMGIRRIIVITLFLCILRAGRLRANYKTYGQL